MSRRKSGAERRRAAQNRAVIRDAIAILINRFERLALADAALLRHHIATEQADADNLRTEVARQQIAMERAANSKRAAEAAIVEAERDRDAAERKLRGYMAIFGPNAVEDWHTMQHRAKTAEADLATLREKYDELTRRNSLLNATAGIDPQAHHRVCAALERAHDYVSNAYADDIDDDARAELLRIITGEQPAEPTPSVSLPHPRQRVAEQPENATTFADPTQQQLADVQQRAAQLGLRGDREKRRADRAEAALDRVRRTLAAILAKPGETPLDELTEYAAKTLTRNGERIIEAQEQRDKARATRNDYARRLDSVAAELGIIADNAGPEAEDIHDTVARIRRVLDGEQPTGGIRGLLEHVGALRPGQPFTVGEQPAEPTPSMRLASASVAASVAQHAPAAPPRMQYRQHGNTVEFRTVPAAGQAAQQPTAGTMEFAEQERARFERLYTRETVRADQAEKRAKIADDNAAAAKRLMERRTNTLRQRAERVEAELAAARTHTAEQGKVIARLLREIGDAEQATADMRKTLSDADTLGHKLLKRAENAEGRCTALERQLEKHRAYSKTFEEHTASIVKQRDDARATLRRTEDDLADARQRLNRRADVQGDCPACGSTSLFLGDGGYVTCPRIECPAPDAATDLLGRARQ